LPTRITRSESKILAEPPTGVMQVLAGVGGDTLAAIWVDLSENGPSYVIAGPPESGRSTALFSAGLSLLDQGCRLICVAPKRSPLLQLRDAGGVLGILEGSDARTPELGEMLSEDGPIAVLVDDAELVDPDNIQLAQLITHGTAPRAMVLAGGLEDIRDAFRGLLLQARRSGTGLLLSPKAHLDAALFNCALPRGAAFVGPPGRGYLIVRSRLQALVQVPLP